MGWGWVGTITVFHSFMAMAAWQAASNTGHCIDGTTTWGHGASRDGTCRPGPCMSIDRPELKRSVLVGRAQGRGRNSPPEPAFEPAPPSIPSCSSERHKASIPKYEWVLSIDLYSYKPLYNAMGMKRSRMLVGGWIPPPPPQPHPSLHHPAGALTWKQTDYQLRPAARPLPAIMWV